MDTNNSDSEDADDEEEEDKEESDGYDSPAMAEDVPDFALHESCILNTIHFVKFDFSWGKNVSDTLGEGFSTGYLEEVLRSFPLNEDGQNKSGDALNNGEASDGEFEIFEQPSDDEEYSDDYYSKKNCEGCFQFDTISTRELRRESITPR
uniref:Uncharacterized protein n=1 Tax=Aegilops tauschii TaxID=37682 RepID=R7W0W1_AEGTA